ncbi:MAG: single-stranded DNA-binding protein [Pontimonas sp.]|jgi:single-strand DNA-binding protein
MIDTLSVSGIVATTPRHIVTSEGLAITSFRLASTQRRFDKGQAQWVDIDTNWYTVVAFRQLALNAHTSLNKGDRVVATGRVKVRNWESEDKSGTAIEIEADALGHDLLWGTSSFERNSLARDLESTSESDADPF